MQRLANVEVGHVYLNDFGKVFRQTFNFEAAQGKFQQSAVSPNSQRLAEGFDGNFRGDLLRGGNGMEIHVDQPALERMVLHLLNHRQRTRGCAVLLNLKFHQDVLARGMRQHTR